MATVLDQLRSMTVVVADTGDVESVRALKPVDCTTNPSILLKALQHPTFADLVSTEVAKGKSAGLSALQVADALTVGVGAALAALVPGRVSTEVDANLSFDMAASVAKGRALIAAYEARGLGRDRILIKLASTWEGIRAAEQLEREGIRCNLTLLFGIHQAVACAEAGVRLISPFVGRILDWYLKDTGRTSYPAAEDPGVVSVTQIFHYYKHFDYATEVMGASFRNIGEITELSGCDLLTIAPKLLKELAETRAPLARKLDAAVSKTQQLSRIPMTEADFRAAHTQNRMASEKLAQGIADFSKAIIGVEQLLKDKLA